MSGTAYRWAIIAILLVGIVSGGTYLILYRAWRLDRWFHNPVARDASGWVLVLWCYFVWALYRTMVAWAAVPARGHVTLAEAVPVLLIGIGLDGALIMRLRRYLGVLQEERKHPTRVCFRCAGRGVVPVGTPRDAFLIPFEDEENDVR